MKTRVHRRALPALVTALATGVITMASTGAVAAAPGAAPRPQVTSTKVVCLGAKNAVRVITAQKRCRAGEVRLTSASTPGPRGPAGPRGATGPRGPAGLQGATGAQGPAGSSLSVYDAAGTRLGTFVWAETATTLRTVTVDAGGTLGLVSYDLSPWGATGGFADFVALYFDSSDCTGPAYIDTSNYMNKAVFPSADVGSATLRAYRVSGAAIPGKVIGSAQYGYGDQACTVSSREMTRAYPTDYLGSFPTPSFVAPYFIR